jgi:hypothetical protein
MTTDEAISEYTATASAIFSKNNRKWASQRDAFKATALEAKIKDLVASKALGERMIASSSDPSDSPGAGRAPACCAFVCAMPARNMAHPQRFRTYPARANAGPDCAIWEAVRATTAAPTFFKRIAIAAGAGHAPLEFVDGGMRCNNPVRKVMDEAHAVFGGGARLGSLVSIGSGGGGAVIGLSKPDAFQKLLLVDVMGVLKDVATDCEKEAQSVARQFRNRPGRYFRFSVTHGADGISLEEWKRMDEVTAHTAAYLMNEEVSHSVDKLVKLLCEPSCAADHDSEITLDNLCMSFTWVP